MLKSISRLLHEQLRMPQLRLREYLRTVVWGEGDELICPVCGCPNTHLTLVQEHKDSKDERPCAELLFHCEGEHQFTVNFQQHKGTTFVHVTPTNDSSEYRRDSSQGWWSEKLPNPRWEPFVLERMKKLKEALNKENCGHRTCGQHWIDTGEGQCLERTEEETV